MQKKISRWPYAQMYFYFFSVVGAMMPFWSLYLHHLEFSSRQIGVLFAVPMLVRIVMPNVWGHLADRSSRVRYLRFGLCGAFLSFTGLLVVDGFYSVLAFMFLHSIFWNGMLSLIEAEVLGSLDKQTHLYGRIRAWGSIGFIVSVLVLGYLFDQVSIRNLPFVVSILLISALLASFFLPKRHSISALQSISTKQFLTITAEKTTVVFFLVMILVHASHGAYYVFFSIYLEELDYSRSEIGALWMLGVLAEIFLFFIVHRLRDKFSLYQLLVCSLVLTGLRWVGIAVATESVVLLICMQCLHAFSFGMIHIVAVEYCRLRYASEMSSRAQGFLNAMGYGVGGTIGALCSGYIWPLGGDVLFLSSAVLIGIACVLATLFLNRCQVLSD